MTNIFSLPGNPTLQKNQLASELQAWGNINTGSDNTPGLLEFCNTLKLAFAPLGGKATLLPLPPRQKINDQGKISGEISAIPSLSALHMQKRPEAPIQILFGGHMDTVFPPSSPFQKTEPIAPGILRGPGCADMKGGLLILLKGLEIFENAASHENIGWEILITPDEEVGSVSSHSLWIAAAKRKQLCFIFEPAFPDGALVSARKGSMNITCVVHGKAAHVGREFHLGRNAIVALSQFIIEAHRLNERQSSLTLNIGDIKSGGAPNIVTGLAICQINIRTDLADELEATYAHLEEMAQSIATSTETRFSLYKLSHRPPKAFDPATEALFNALKECAKTIGLDIHWRKSGGVCDGNLIAAQGIPTIDTLGAVGGNIHTEEEYVCIESLPERAHLLALFLMQLEANHTNLKVS